MNTSLALEKEFYHFKVVVMGPDKDGWFSARVFGFKETYALSTSAEGALSFALEKLSKVVREENNDN